jgi:hypothetical protein
MRVLIDIGHPGHVHLFKPFANEMIRRGHEILFTCREKEFEIELLKAEKFNYISFGKKFTSTVGKLSGLLKFDGMELKAAIKFKPDIFLSHGSPYAAHVAWLMRKPHISFEDTFNFEQIRFYKPFTDTILTSTYNHPYLGKNNLRYSGYHELAYLHPDVFTPDEKVLAELGLQKNERFAILRFVSWNATHDKGHKGINLENKIHAVNKLREHVKVFISSEKQLPSQLENYKFPLAPERMHHAIAFASLMFGESATMITEAAVLGVPGIYLDNSGRLYTSEIEKKYGLIFNYSESETDQLKAIEKAVEILGEPKSKWEEGRKKLLSEKINVTKFLLWFIENFPESKLKLKKDRDYQMSFK